MNPPVNSNPVSVAYSDTIPATPGNEPLADGLLKPIVQRGKQPRSNQDRSKYKPHQNKRECFRRLKQVVHDQLSMAGVTDAQDFIIEAATREAERVLSESRADTPIASEIQDTL